MSDSKLTCDYGSDVDEEYEESRASSVVECQAASLEDRPEDRKRRNIRANNTKKMAKNSPSLAYFAWKIYMQIAKTNV